MFHKIAALVLLISLCGCMTTQPDRGRYYELGPEWAPLKEVRERSRRSGLVGAVLDLAIKSDTAVTTVLPYVYVDDVDEFIARNPPESTKFRGLMRHEQEHAYRQKARGLYTWLAKYLYDKEFALDEELLGYYHQIKTYQSGGLLVNPDAIAAALAGYRNLSGKLIGFEEARQWVRDVLAGRWLPPSD